jgi:hypothetical protein
MNGAYYEVYEDGSLYYLGEDEAPALSKKNFTGVLRLYKYGVCPTKLDYKKLKLTFDEGKLVEIER